MLKLELKEIREQQDLLFRFINFLKQEGAVHVLQFCLAAGKNTTRPGPFKVSESMASSESCLLPEEFNDKILSPELSELELQHLHGDVVHIYQTYCLEESLDKIRFESFIVEELRNSESYSASGPGFIWFTSLV